MAQVLFWLAVLFIIYTYFGYFIIIALLAKAVKPPIYSPIEFPTVTLLIPAYNEELVIRRKIQNCLELDYPKEKLQILVAADGSDDSTPDIVRDYLGNRVELNYIPERNGKMAAINRAVPKCSGEIIVFSDANNFYNPDVIKKLVMPFANEKVGATTGAKRIIEDGQELSSAESIYWKYESAIKKYETLLGSCVAAVGEMFAIRKELFEPAPKNIINDDHYITLSLLRRGYDVIYIPEAKSFEYVSPTFKDEIKRRKRISSGSFQTIFLSTQILPFNRPFEVWKEISHKYFRSFIPFAMILAITSNLFVIIFPPNATRMTLLNLAYPFNWFFFISQLVFYTIGLSGNFVKFPGRIGKILYLPTFLINSNYALVCGIKDYFRKKDAFIWDKVRRTDLR